MQPVTTSPNARALERILAVVPRWTAVRPADEAVGLPDRVLLHAGPPLPDPKSPPPPDHPPPPPPLSPLDDQPPPLQLPVEPPGSIDEPPRRKPLLLALSEER